MKKVSNVILRSILRDAVSEHCERAIKDPALAQQVNEYLEDLILGQNRAQERHPDAFGGFCPDDNTPMGDL